MQGAVHGPSGLEILDGSFCVQIIAKGTGIIIFPWNVW